MKKVLSAIFILLVLTISTSGQMKKASNWVGKFGIAGGFTPVYLFPDLEGINKNLFGFNVDKLPESGMIGFGGTGYGYIMVVKNLRLGGVGFGASTSVDNTQNGLKEEIVYSTGVGGVTVEYTLPFIKGYAVSVGAILGVGSIEIETYRNGGAVDFENISGYNPVASLVVPDENHVLKNTYFIFTPTINIDFPLNRFLAIRFGGGYNISFGSEWKADNGRDVNNVPDNLNGSYPFIQTGILVGLFAY